MEVIKINRKSLIESEKNQLSSIYLAFCRAKTFTSAGIIKNYKSKKVRKELSEYIGVSSRTLDRYIKRWKEQDWAYAYFTVEGVNTLQFRSLSKVEKNLTGSKKATVSTKVKWKGIKTTLNNFRGYTLYKSLESQYRKIEYQLRNYDKVIAQLFKNGHYEAVREISLNHTYGNLKGINFILGLSRQGVSNLFSKSSRSTGDRYISKLKEGGILNESKRKFEIGRFYNVGSRFFSLTEKENEKGYSYTQVVKRENENYVKVMRVLSNLFTFNIDSLREGIILRDGEEDVFEKVLKYNKWITTVALNNKGETLFKSRS